jgi:hypothetical protein
MLTAALISTGPERGERVTAPGADELRARVRDLCQRGEVGEAIQVAERAADLAPWDAESWALLSAVHSAAGHPHDALRIHLICIARAGWSGVSRCRPPFDLEAMR